MGDDSKDSKLADKIQKEVLLYYSEKRIALPSYCYFKARNKPVMDYVMKTAASTGYDIKGDVNEYFRKIPVIQNNNDKLQVFSEINRLFKKNMFNQQSDNFADKELIRKELEMKGRS